MISLFDGLFLGVITLGALYLYLSLTFTYWKKRGVICDEKLSVIFGSMADAFMAKKPWGQIFTDLYWKFPDKKVVGWYKFRDPGILLRDPKLCQKVLVTDFHSFRNNDAFVDPVVDPILGNNIFVLRDDTWKKARALITPAFTAGKIKLMYPTVKVVADEMVSYLKEHPEDIHMKTTMARYTGEIVARCAFGIEGNSFKEPKPKIHELGHLMFEPTIIQNLKMISFMALPKLTKLLKLKLVPDKVIKFFDSVLRDVIVHRQENNIERNDFIQYLLEVKKKTQEVAKGNIQSDIITKTYTDDDVLSGCIMFFLEGYETSSLVMNNVLYQLALHKEVQDRLREEIDATLEEGELTFEKLQGMTYLNQVFLETQRVLPVMFNMQKICTEQYVMDIGEKEPLVIEKDIPVVIPTYALQRDPLYWEDAEAFKPERFTEKEEATAKANGVFMPFGNGPRMCPGMRIATTIIKAGIVQIISKLEVLPTSRTPKKITPDPKYFMIAHKGGIYLRFVERSR